VSVRIENCTSAGDNHSVFLATGNTAKDAVRGSIEFANCTFQAGRSGGVVIEGKPVGGCRVRFADCSILDPASGIPILLKSRKKATEPIGGVEFDDCLIRDSQDRKPIAYDDTAAKAPLEAVSGTIVLERNGERERIEITPEWLAKSP
jgi:hypothetical protein